MLEMIKFVFSISNFKVSSSSWGSYSTSGDDGCLEKVIDLCTKMCNPPPWPWGRSLHTVV